MRSLRISFLQTIHFATLQVGRKGTNLVTRKSQRRKRSHRSSIARGSAERHYLDKRKGILLQRIVVPNDSGEVVRYSLAYIDPTIHAGDNGRVLGYDNDHGYHHRHFMGRVTPVEFESFEKLEERFEWEFWEIYDENHGRNRSH